MNTKTKRKLNIIDILIIAALIAAAVAAGFGVLQSIGAVGERVTVKYVMEISPIDNDLVSNVVEGHGVYNYEDSDLIGTVSAVASSQAYHIGTDSQGEQVSSPIEGYSTLHITVTCQAVKTDTGYAVGNTVIGIGKKLSLRLPDLYCEGKCVSIEIVE